MTWYGMPGAGRRALPLLALLIFSLICLAGCSLMLPALPGPPAAAPAAVASPAPGQLDSRGGKAQTATPPGGLGIATPAPGERLPTIPFNSLPAEAQSVLRLIARGGPFPYDQDGAVFQNREGLLPRKAAGYYREYTVETPGSRDRGARRIVAGASGERYYTDDHYASFKRVLP